MQGVHDQLVFRPPEQDGDPEALFDVLAQVVAQFAVETQQQQSVQSEPLHHQRSAKAA